ncbi:Trehalose synthase [uncultured archaeon]|nr:Trehalose synthase [uncultured archaeon]
MNICIIAKSLPAHVIGGMEIHVQELVDGIVKKGHKVTVITTKHPKGIDKEEKKNLKIYYVGDEPIKYTDKFYEGSAKLFDKLNKTEKFDVVHSQSTAAIGLQIHSIKTPPTVISFHGTSIDEIKSRINVLFSKVSLVNKIKSFIMIFKISSAHILYTIHGYKFDGVIATSNEQVGVLTKWYNFQARNIYKVFNGVDIEGFKPRKKSTVLNKYNGENHKIILTVSKIIEQKGIQNIILAMPNILKYDGNIKLVIVGKGDYMANLNNLVQKLSIGNNVIFIGNVPFESLPDYFNACDLFVNPTIRQNGYDLTILEAMACEKPVVVSNIGSVPTAIEDGVDGLLVPTGDIKKLAEAVIKVLKDQELAKRLGKAARKKIEEKFSLERMVDSTIKVYEEVIRRNKERSI